MRFAAKIFFGVVVAVSLGLAGSLLRGQATAAQPTAELQVPGSLDALYPPVAGQPVYLFHMLKLDEYFTGIIADLLEDDLPGAKGNYEDFRAQYAEVRGLVPEWEPYYPTGPVEQMAAAFASGDRGRLMAAFEEVGKTCHHCHLMTMVPVQQRYHWGDFGAITVEDPLTHDIADYSRFKKYLSTNLTGIRVNLRQGQPDNALRQFESFQARFETLKESCLTCHDRESLDFIDGEVQERVEELGRALRNPRSSPETLTSLIQAIGKESCSKCHLVHVPAAVARARAR